MRAIERDTRATGTTEELATFLAGLRFADLPTEVVERAKELFLDGVAAVHIKGRRRTAQLLLRHQQGGRFGKQRGDRSHPPSKLYATVRLAAHTERRGNWHRKSIEEAL